MAAALAAQRWRAFILAGEFLHWFLFSEKVAIFSCRQHVRAT
jgi:hypothetical protein